MSKHIQDQLTLLRLPKKELSFLFKKQQFQFCKDMGPYQHETFSTSKIGVCTRSERREHTRSMLYNRVAQLGISVRRVKNINKFKVMGLFFDQEMTGPFSV